MANVADIDHFTLIVQNVFRYKTKQKKKYVKIAALGHVTSKLFVAYTLQMDLLFTTVFCEANSATKTSSSGWPLKTTNIQRNQKTWRLKPSKSTRTF